MHRHFTWSHAALCDYLSVTYLWIEDKSDQVLQLDPDRCIVPATTPWIASVFHRWTRSRSTAPGRHLKGVEIIINRHLPATNPNFLIRPVHLSPFSMSHVWKLLWSELKPPTANIYCRKRNYLHDLSDLNISAAYKNGVAWAGPIKTPTLDVVECERCFVFRNSPPPLL